MSEASTKRSRHLVDPEVLPIAEALPDFEMTAEALPAMRASYSEMADSYWASVPLDMTGLTLGEHRIAGVAGEPEVRILVLDPSDRSDRRPAILDIHGGGHVIGTADGNLRVASMLARELGAVVVIVDYRLAPETVYPGSLNDCHAALKWLVANAGAYHVDPDRIGIQGGSAGGTLAAGLALLNRDGDDVPIRHLHLVNPMLDDRTGTTRAASHYVGEYCWTRQANTFGWSSLLGTAPGGPGVSPYAAPGRMEDLAGMPPTFISCGTIDLFIEESLDFARRLITAGVPTELHVYPGRPHGLATGGPGRLQAIVDRDDLAAWRQALTP